MNDLILDHSIINARPPFLPVHIEGVATVACLELRFETGLLNLAFKPMKDSVMVLQELVRIALPVSLNVDRFRRSLTAGGALFNALVRLRCAALTDSSILTACGDVRTELLKLAEKPYIGDAYWESGTPGCCDPVLDPYDRWIYGVDSNWNKAERCKAWVLGFPSWFEKSSSNLAIVDVKDLLEIGLTPVTAKIGVSRDHADYGEARREWVELAIESLVARVQETLKDRSILAGEVFRNLVVDEGHYFSISLEASNGVTVTSSTASPRRLITFFSLVRSVGRRHLAKGLQMIRSVPVT